MGGFLATHDPAHEQERLGTSRPSLTALKQTERSGHKAAMAAFDTIGTVRVARRNGPTPVLPER